MGLVCLKKFIIFGACILIVFCSAICLAEQESNILHQNAIKQARDGNFSRALKDIKQAMVQDSSSVDIKADYIVILAWANKHEQAIREYELISKTDTLPEYAVIEVARSYRLTKRFKQAIKLYGSYLLNNPNNQKAKNGLVHTYFEAGKISELYAFINQSSDNDPEKLGWILIESFISMQSIKKHKAIKSVFDQALKYFSENIPAKLAVVKMLMNNKQYDYSQEVLDRIFKTEPSNMDALFLQAELYESQAEFFKTYNVYNKILKLYPNSQVAKSLKYRVLLNMGSNELVEQMLFESKDKIDNDIMRLLWGNKVVARVEWSEHRQALKNLESNERKVHDAGIKMSKAAVESSLFLRRTIYDKFLVLRKLELMDELLDEYEYYAEMDLDLPVWVRLAAADAYLYLQSPEYALAIYEGVYSEKEDKSGNIRISIYNILVELGEYEKAAKLLDEVDSEQPVMQKDRGFLRENWKKVDLNINKGWNLMYQDKLKQAQSYLEKLLLRAPFNTNTRNAIAHTYLWRGWPRLALEEFQILKTLEPKHIPATVGYCYALNENNYHKQAREKAKELLKKFPKNKHIKKLNRKLEIQDMSTLRMGAGFIAESGGVDEFAWYARWDEPVSSWKTIFVRFDHKKVKQSTFNDTLDRMQLGIDFRLNRDWYLLSAISLNTSGDDAGILNQLKWQPDDHLTFVAGYDTYSLSVPSRARVKGIDAKQIDVSAQYRESEDFLARITMSFLDLSDDNQVNSYILYLDKAITTEAYWKTRIGLEGYYGDYKKTNVDYFSPDTIYSIYVVPMLEHVWFRHYDSAWVDRFYLGIGRQWQKTFSAAGLGYFRYEQDHTIDDLFSFLIGVTFSHNVYDGDGTDAWTADIAIKKHF